ncbi:MAG: hypothetical protein JNK67_02675 [Alphaproteobacteria bacterium]|nr:hypothetical protein [Alphaproteobacteria bacterium]
MLFVVRAAQLAGQNLPEAAEAAGRFRQNLPHRRSRAFEPKPQTVAVPGFRRRPRFGIVVALMDGLIASPSSE